MSSDLTGQRIQGKENNIPARRDHGKFQNVRDEARDDETDDAGDDAADDAHMTEYDVAQGLWERSCGFYRFPAWGDG